MSDGQGRRPAHLVLSGGGVRCLSFVGALEQLEREFSWASVSACSMGTLIGAMRCVGMSPQEMRQAVLAFDLRAVPELHPWRVASRAWRLVRPPHALVLNSPMPAIFRQLVGDDRVDGTLADLDPPLAAGAVDVHRRRLVVYSSAMHPDLPIARPPPDHHVAPAAVPTRPAGQEPPRRRQRELVGPDLAHRRLRRGLPDRGAPRD